MDKPRVSNEELETYGYYTDSDYADVKADLKDCREELKGFIAVAQQHLDCGNLKAPIVVVQNGIKYLRAKYWPEEG